MNSGVNKSKFVSDIKMSGDKFRKSSLKDEAARKGSLLDNAPRKMSLYTEDRPRRLSVLGPRRRNSGVSRPNTI